MTQQHAADGIAAVVAAYQAAVYARDVDAFVSLYDSGVQVFDMWGRWSHEGIDTWRAMASEWFGALGSERVAVTVDGLQIHAADGLGTAQAFLTYTALSAEGVALRSLDNRLTLILRLRDGAWKIVHEHTSAPAQFETLKVSLHRESA